MHSIRAGKQVCSFIRIMKIEDIIKKLEEIKKQNKIEMQAKYEVDSYKFGKFILASELIQWISVWKIK